MPWFQRGKLIPPPHATDALPGAKCSEDVEKKVVFHHGGTGTP